MCLGGQQCFGHDLFISTKYNLLSLIYKAIFHFFQVCISLSPPLQVKHHLLYKLLPDFMTELLFIIGNLILIVE